MFEIPESGYDLNLSVLASGGYSGTYYTQQSLGKNIFWQWTSWDGGRDCYLYYKSVNTKTKSVTSRNLRCITHNCIGVNLTLNKLFTLDGIYNLNSDFTKGEKIKDLIINNAQTTPVFYNFSTDSSAMNNFLHQIAGSNFYITRGLIKSGKQYLLEFNENTNEFNCLGEYSSEFTVTNDFNGTPSTFSGNEYILNGDAQQIGFKINGSAYFYDINKASLESSKLLTSYNSYDVYGNLIVGTMPNNGALNIVPSTVAQPIPAGYTSGGTVSAVDSTIDSNILAENIKAGVTILGVTGTLESGIDTSDATATVSDILNNKTAYVNGVKLTGTASAKTLGLRPDYLATGTTVLGVTGRNNGFIPQNCTPVISLVTDSNVGFNNLPASIDLSNDAFMNIVTNNQTNETIKSLQEFDAPYFVMTVGNDIYSMSETNRLDVSIWVCGAPYSNIATGLDPYGDGTSKYLHIESPYNQTACPTLTFSFGGNINSGSTFDEALNEIFNTVLANNQWDNLTHITFDDPYYMYRSDEDSTAGGFSVGVSSKIFAVYSNYNFNAIYS